MLLVGLTGGIGSGKTTVARMLADRGAVILDADEFAHRAIDRGTPGYMLVAQAFPEVIRENGEVDREALARRVFRDREARERLEVIVHPEVARMFAEALEPHRDTDRIVVYAVPLLAEKGLADGFDVVVVVTADAETRVHRLAQGRGMTEAAVRERIAAQLPDEERRKVADLVVENDGSIEELEDRVDVLWSELCARIIGGQ